MSLKAHSTLINVTKCPSKSKCKLTSPLYITLDSVCAQVISEVRIRVNA